MYLSTTAATPVTCQSLAYSSALYCALEYHRYPDSRQSLAPDSPHATDVKSDKAHGWCSSQHRLDECHQTDSQDENWQFDKYPPTPYQAANHQQYSGNHCKRKNPAARLDGSKAWFLLKDQY